MWTAVSNLLFALACSGGADTAEPAVEGFFSTEELAIIASLTPLPAVPEDPTNAVADQDDAAHFGQWLFFDPRLSSSSEVSCATCHDPDQGFSDGLTLSVGLDSTARHAPSILNTAYNRWMNWDGRCDSHWCQALGPIEDPAEMGLTRLEVAHLLAADALAPGRANAGKAYFITDDEPVVLWDWINTLFSEVGVAPVTGRVSVGVAKLAGTALEWIWRTFSRPGEPPMTRFVAGQLSTHHHYDLSAARSDFGYAMKVDPDEGFEKMVAWFKANG